jgi:hypothetical protein
MKAIRLASLAAALAICAAGDPAIAEIPAKPQPTFNAALDEWVGAVRSWSAARDLAERTIAAHPTEALVADDLIAAEAYGNGLAAAKPEPLTTERLHTMAISLWAVIGHCAIVAVRLEPRA